MKTEHAKAASAIRKELKATFPGITFMVRSEGYSMGNSVNVGWTDGPTREMVNRVIKKYQYGHFDSMTDMYDMTNDREDVPQSKYVMADRKVSQWRKDFLKKEIAKRYGFQNINDEQEWYNKFHQWSDMVLYGELSKLAF